jgi:hypothetical protein
MPSLDRAREPRPREHPGRASGATRALSIGRRLALVLAALACGEASSRPPLPAFPGAEGGGARALGGRGGAVLAVTTLDDSGPGSLRSCLEASGPRTCVFRVAGVVQLASSLVVRHPYVTVAGQTAPGGGITISGKQLNDYVFRVNTHDVVMRYLRIQKRFNLAADGSNAGGGITHDYDSYRDVYDHLSILWSQDKLFAVWTNDWAAGFLKRDITLQWSILGQPLEPQPMGVLTGCQTTGSECGAITNVDFHHDYWVEIDRRNPLLKNRSSRFVNNVVYNWGAWAAAFGGGIEADIVGNVFKRGPCSGTETVPGCNDFYGGVNVRAHPVSIFTEADTVAPGPPSVYMRDNLGPQGTDWQLAAEGANESPANDGPRVRPGWRRSTPRPVGYSSVTITADPVVADGGAGLLGKLFAPTGVGASARLDCLGNLRSNRDGNDADLIGRFGASYAATGTGSTKNLDDFALTPQDYLAFLAGKVTMTNPWFREPKEWPFYEGQVPGVPGPGDVHDPVSIAPDAVCAVGVTDPTDCVCPDADGDGMPDAWEAAWKLNPQDPSDAAGASRWNDGYTNLEHYLSGRFPAPSGGG